MPRLRIVSINDVYTLENLPRLATLVHRARTEDPPDTLLVTLAGDFLSPSILSSLDGGRGMVDCMNALGVTHVTFGNHEDDVATDELRRRVTELSARWLATNVRSRDLAIAALPVHDVVAVGGLRVGLVGVVMDDPAVYRRAPFGEATVLPPNAAALEAAARLESAGCAAVVALTHQFSEEDRALVRAASAANAKLALVIGGHEHTTLLEEVNGVWIVKAGADAVHAVVTDVVWSEPAAPPVVTPRLVDVADYPEDAALRARVDAHMMCVHDLETATLVKLAPGEALSSVGTRARQTTMGALVCTRVRDALGADACLFNGGGVRGSKTYETRFTYGDLKTEVPFDNEVVVVRLPGRVVAEAVAASRAHAPAESGGFLQVDDRAVVEEPAHQLVALGGAPVDPAREYRVAIVRDLFFGLDHIEPLVRFAKERPEAIPAAGSGRDVKLVLVDAFSVALWEHLGGFEAVDANHDGVVTEPEVEAAVARALHEAPSPVTAALVIHALDKDHDETISRAEAEPGPRRDP